MNGIKVQPGYKEINFVVFLLLPVRKTIRIPAPVLRLR
jgi:hypothetical protein